MKIKVLVFIGILSLFFTNCKKDELSTSETQEIIDFPADDFYSEEIQVFDETGKHSISMTVVAKDEEAFSRHIKSWEYKLNVLFPESDIENSDEQSEDEYSSSNNEGSEKSINDIYTIINEVNIPENASGFGIDVSAKELSHLKSGWTTTKWYTGPKWYHHAKVQWHSSSNSNNAIGVNWWTKYSSGSLWHEKEFVELNSTNEFDEFSYSSYRIEVKIRHNWDNYSVYFKHWEVDGWGEDLNHHYLGNDK